MAATASVGTGFTLTRAGQSWNIIDVDGPDVSIATIEANKMSTTGWMDYICGTLIDGGTVTLTIETGTTMPTLGTFVPTTLSFTGGLSVSGSMAITSWKPSAAVEEKETATITLKVSGALT